MIYFALLRGINVSGKNIIRMAELRASLAKLGFAGLETYVQSGNVIFSTAKTANDNLAVKIAARIKKDFGFDVPVTVRSQAEFASMVKQNPFLKTKGMDLTKLHVTFLNGSAAKSGLAQLAAIPAGKDEFKVVGAHVYLHCPVSYGETKLSNAAIERALDCGATTRNWKTVNALLELAAKRA